MPDVIRRFLQFLEKHIHGLVGNDMRSAATGFSQYSKARYLDSALKRYDMLKSKGPGSPKLDKAERHGDGQALVRVSSASSRSAVLVLLWWSNERLNSTSMVGLSCPVLKSPDQTDKRWLNMLLRYVQSTKYASTEYRPKVLGPGVLKVYTDSDWAQGPTTGASTSGAVMVCEGCRNHAHAQVQPAVVLASFGAELYAACGGLGEAILDTTAKDFVETGAMNDDLDRSAAQQVLSHAGSRKAEALGDTSTAVSRNCFRRLIVGASGCAKCITPKRRSLRHSTK